MYSCRYMCTSGKFLEGRRAGGRGVGERRGRDKTGDKDDGQINASCSSSVFLLLNGYGGEKCTKQQYH